MALFPIRAFLEDRKVSAHRPLGSVCFDQVGVHLITVDAQYGGKCSSNMHLYQYLSLSVEIL